MTKSDQTFALDPLVVPEGTAAYRALADLLRKSINRGDFDVGERLPTEVELVRCFSLSRNTVRRALQDLVAEDVVRRTPGKGTYLAPEGNGYLRSVGSVEDLLGFANGSVWLTHRPLTLEADIEAAGRLRSQTDQVYAGVFIRKQDDRALSVSRVALPQSVGRILVERGELTTEGEISDRTIVNRVDEATAHSVTVIHQSITATAMPVEYAELLETEVRTPAMRIDRLYLDSREQAVELAVSYFNPERYTYRIELHRRGAAPASHSEIAAPATAAD